MCATSSGTPTLAGEPCGLDEIEDLAAEPRGAFLVPDRSRGDRVAAHTLLAIGGRDASACRPERPVLDVV